MELPTDPTGKIGTPDLVLDPLFNLDNLNEKSFHLYLYDTLHILSALVVLSSDVSIAGRFGHHSDRAIRYVVAKGEQPILFRIVTSLVA